MGFVTLVDVGPNDKYYHCNNCTWQVCGRQERIIREHNRLAVSGWQKRVQGQAPEWPTDAETVFKEVAQCGGRIVPRTDAHNSYVQETERKKDAG